MFRPPCGPTRPTSQSRWLDQLCYPLTHHEGVRQGEELVFTSADIGTQKNVSAKAKGRLLRLSADFRSPSAPALTLN